MKFKHSIILILLSGVLTAISTPGFISPFFLFFSFVPAFFVFKQSTPFKAFLYGVFHGFVVYSIIYYWVVNSFSVMYKMDRVWAVVAYILMAVLLLAFYHGIFALCCSFFMTKKARQTSYRPQLIAPFFLSLLWPLIEYCRGLIFPAINIGTLASGFYKYPFLLQSVHFLGEHVFSFVIILINFSIFLFIDLKFNKSNNREKTSFSPSYLCAPVIAVLIAILFIVYGKISYRDITNKPDYKGSQIVLIQANIAANKKWKNEYTSEILTKYYQMTKKYAKKGQIVLWPETAINFYPQILSVHSDSLIRFARDNGVMIVAGAPEFQKSNPNTLYYNSIFKISDKGIKSVYKKEKLLPFAEYCPVSLFYPLFKHAFGSTEYTAYYENENLVADGINAGIAICFETTFPDIIENRSESSELLVFFSDDVWLGRGPGSEQHLASMVMRAIENRKWVISCVNSGVSAIIDPQGRIIQRLEFDREGALYFPPLSNPG